MSYKGFRMSYSVVSKTQADLARELEIVCTAFQNVGWREVDFEPDTGIPTTVIFEWLLDEKPVRPYINLP